MIKSLYTSATGMQAQQTNLDTISHNIANVNTTGFKKSRAEFEDLLYQIQREPGSAVGANALSPTGVQVGLGVRTASIQKDFEGGSASVTKNPLDLSVEGNGFFPVQMDNGQIGYTRDGSFRKDAQGRITDKNGFVLQPEITIPPNTIAIQITAQGQIFLTYAEQQEPQLVGQLQLVNFVNPTGLRSIGKNMFVPSTASGLPQQGNPNEGGLGVIAQGQLEASNVNIVEEMVNMISAQRAYETNSKAIQAADQLLQYTNSLR